MGTMKNEILKKNFHLLTSFFFYLLLTHSYCFLTMVSHYSSYFHLHLRYLHRDLRWVSESLECWFPILECLVENNFSFIYFRITILLACWKFLHYFTISSNCFSAWRVRNEVSSRRFSFEKENTNVLFHVHVSVDLGQVTWRRFTHLNNQKTIQSSLTVYDVADE